ncbi:MAG TPA: hypothetical protein PKM65_20235 [Spirochaetota bacterium]|nr:hypothetical protein [Spirochaetota bacterium]
MFGKDEKVLELDEFAAVDDLLKAAEEDEDEDDEDEGEDEGEKGYDEEYLKKHFKRFMKENKGGVKKYAEELGMLGKAVEMSIDDDEVANADGVLVEGTAFIKAQSEFNAKVLDGMESMMEEMVRMRAILGYNTDLAKASAILAKENSDSVDMLMKAPNPVKGVIGAPLAKAADASAPLQKASGMTFAEIKRMVLKATLDGNDDAAKIVTAVDACGGNIHRLPAHALKIIDSLVS